MERRFGSFSRSVELPQGLDLNRVEANFKNGVLVVKAPKTEEYKSRSRSIPIGCNGQQSKGLTDQGDDNNKNEKEN